MRELADSRVIRRSRTVRSPGSGRCCMSRAPAPRLQQTSQPRLRPAHRPNQRSPRTDRGKGIRVVVVDTGLYRKAGELPWMRAVTGDPDLGEAVSTRAVSAAARVQAPTIYRDVRGQAGPARRSRPVRFRDHLTGLSADFLVVDGRDITALREVRMLVVRGVLLGRDA